MTDQFDKTKILNYITSNQPVNTISLTRHFMLITPSLVLDLTLKLVLEGAVAFNQFGELVTTKATTATKEENKKPFQAISLCENIFSFVRDAGSASLSCITEHTLNDPRTGTIVLSLLASRELYVNHNQHLVFNGYEDDA